MLTQARNLVGGFVVAAAVVMTPMAAPASAAVEAQGQQNGLVNVAVIDLIDGDVLSNNRVGVGVAAGIAASVCGVQAQVGVIAQQLARGAPVSCNNTASGQGVRITQ